MLSRRFLRIKVIKALYSHFKSESDSLITSEKNLMNSINKSYDLYFQMLELIVNVKRYAEERLEIGKNKKLPSAEDLNPNTRFVDNAAIAQLEAGEALNDYLAKKSLGWSQYPELIKHLYTKMVESDYYQAYMTMPLTSYRDDIKLVEEFYVTTVQDDELLESVVEEQSIMWCDDIDFILIMVLRTLENMKQKQTDVPILQQYKSEEDIDFVKRLFRKSVVNFNDYQTRIEKFTQNWDLERIAFLDNIIMATAIAELLEFDSIPVKVTMDEYIEISKFYSTPGSSLFINGVLDKITEALKTEGLINKTGRGLLS